MAFKDWAQPLATVIGTGLGLATAKWQDRRQIRQQQKLQNMQIQGQKQMGLFNQAQAMKMWEDTNYKAQTDQMRKAGLNIGLMYEGGGPGGTLQQPSGNVSGATAPVGGNEIGMGLQAGMQIAMLKAQKENVEADTELKRIDAETKGTTQTDQAKATLDNLRQATKNLKVQEAILEYDKTIREIEANTAGKTKEQQVELINEALKKLKGEAVSAETKGQIDTETKEIIIEGADLANKQIKQNITASEVGVKATKAGIKATEAGTKLTEKKIEETTQNIKNLEATEEGQILLNAMRANGVEPTDNVALRIASKWLQNNDISMKSFTQKTKKIMLWLKGEYGEQTMERFKEIMKE